MSVEQSVLEKLWISYERTETTSELVDYALSVMTEEEKNNSTVRWIVQKRGILDRDENIFDLIERMLDLPFSPQKYRNDTWTPLETKLENDDFKEYYEEYNDLLDKALKKHNL